jgi:hypothetical protein
MRLAFRRTPSGQALPHQPEQPVHALEVTSAGQVLHQTGEGLQVREHARASSPRADVEQGRPIS